MKNHVPVTALLCALTFLGCSKSHEEASKETEMVTMPTLGVSINKPVNWQLIQNSDDFFVLKGPGGQVQLIRSTTSGGVSLDELADECAGRVQKKEMIPGGAFFILCDNKKSGSKAVKVELSTGKRTSVRCQWETNGNPATIESVCKTMRKMSSNVVRRRQ